MRDKKVYSGKVKRGKRAEFDTYNQLACKNCKITFHKRMGSEAHGRELRPTPPSVIRSTKSLSRIPMVRTKVKKEEVRWI